MECLLLVGCLDDDAAAVNLLLIDFCLDSVSTSIVRLFAAFISYPIWFVSSN
jgi:hypothetical protein